MSWSRNLNGGRPALGVQKSTSRSCYTRPGLSIASQILAAQCALAKLTSTLFFSRLSSVIPPEAKLPRLVFFADAHGLAVLEPNLTNNQHVVAWRGKSKHKRCSTWLWADSTEASLEKCTQQRGSARTAQRVYWQEQGSNA